MSVTWGDRPRPSTHPAERYRRAREALAVQLADVVHLFGQLDPSEHVHIGDELLELLDDAGSRVEQIIVSGPPPRVVVDMDTGGRT